MIDINKFVNYIFCVYNEHKRNQGSYAVIKCHKGDN